MATVSYGTITVTDLTDITDVYLEYCMVEAGKTASQVEAKSIWTSPEVSWSTTYPTWQNGYEIWVRQVQIKEGIESGIYTVQFSATTTNSVIFRLHGYDSNGQWLRQLFTTTITSTSTLPIIQTLELPSDVKFVRLSYPLTGVENTGIFKGESTSNGTGLIDTSTNESGSIPESGTPASNSSFNRTQLIAVYPQGYGTPYLDTAVNQIANSIYTINTNVTGLDNRLKAFFWPGDSSYSGAFAVAKTSNDGLDITNANTYGFNTRVATGLVSIGYNKIPLSEWGINEGLKMYYPVLDNGEVVNNKLGMQLLTNSLTFYKANNSSNKALEIDTNGINLYGSSTTTTDATLTVNGLVLTKGGITAGTHSSTEEQNMATFEYVQENVAINALTINLEADINGKESVDIIHTNKNIAILPQSLLDAERNSDGITWCATSNSSYHVSGTATAQSDSVASRDYGGVINGNLRFLSKGTYTITATKEGTGGGYVHLRGFTSNNTTYRTLVALSKWNTPQTFTLDDDAFYLIRGRVAANAVVDYEVTIQIEKGAEGTTYIENEYELKTISLGQKVYKGILEAKSGTLTITHQIFDVNFAEVTETQAGDSTTNYKGFYSDIVPNIKKPENQEIPDMYCNRLTVTSRYDNYRNTEGIAIDQTEGRAYIYLTDISSMTLTEAQTWLEDNPIQIVYPLEKPQVIQLGVMNITNFENTNNIWSSSGTITLEWGNIIYLSTEDFGSYTINGSTFLDWREIIGANFGIRVDGSLYAVNANINGTINATSGIIGGFTIGNNELYSNNKTDVKSTEKGTYIGPLGFNISDGNSENTTFFTSDEVSIGGVLNWSAASGDNLSNLTIKADEIIIGKDNNNNDFKVKSLLTDAIGINQQQDQEINNLINITNVLEDYDKFITVVVNGNDPYIDFQYKTTDYKPKIKITTNSISFSLDEEENIITQITKINNDSLMHTTFGEFENLRMRAGGQGNLTWIARDNGHLSLKVVE